MSVNTVILELSQQIAYLQSQYDILAVENQRLKSESEIKVNRKTRSRNSKKANPFLLKAVTAIKEQRLKDLESKYSDDLKIIRSRYPRWNPEVSFFDNWG